MKPFYVCELSLLFFVGATLPLACGGTSEEAARCVHDGKTYDAGENFPSDDGCNTCSCMSDGDVACTARGCLSCDDISAMYGSLMDQAKACDSDEPDACSTKVVAGLRCACETFVSPTEYDADAASSLQQLYTAAECGEGILCGPCLAPTSAHCSAEGQCVDDVEP